MIKRGPLPKPEFDMQVVIIYTCQKGFHSVPFAVHVQQWWRVP